MFNILIKINNRNIARLQRLPLHLATYSKKKGVYLFSTSQEQSQINNQSFNQERIKRQQEIQFRKRTMEDLEIKKIRERVQNTQGKYNPTIAYLKLYSNYFQIVVFLGAVSLILIIFVIVGGVHQDPLTNKKKLIIVSQKFQKSIDSILRNMMTTQLCGSYSLNDTNSNSLKRKCLEMESFIEQKTTRKYKIVVLPTEQHIINILPSSIIISKNMFALNGVRKEDLQNFILIMERLFSKRLHIKQLALSNVFLYFLVKIKENTNTQVKFSSIYSRKYTESEMESAMRQICTAYGASLQQLGLSVDKVFRSLGQQLYKQQSKFSLLNRFQNLMRLQ